MNAMKMKVWAMAVMVSMAGGTLLAQDAEQPPEAEKPMMDRQEMMNKHHQMMVERMQMMQEQLRQMDRELQQKVDAIAAAEGDAKVDAIAEAVTLIAKQRQQMHEKQIEMMQNMMQKKDWRGHKSWGRDQEKKMMCPMCEKMQSENGPEAQAGDDAENGAEVEVEVQPAE